MNLPFLKSHKKSKKSYFFSLLIKPFRIGAILFEEENGELIILSSKELDTLKEVDTLSAEELLVTADKAISSVEPNSPPDVTVEKTIFSVPYSWVEDGKIKQEYLSKLKKLCEDLGLVPMGYLMSIEAVIHHLQRKEGAPISAIFVESYESKVLLYLVKGGRILEFADSNIEGDVITTVENVLKRIDSVDVLPSKIILLNHEDAADNQQEFLSHTWPSDIVFLHLPQVVTLDKGVENKATINGVASQMELSVANKAKAVSISEESEASEQVIVGDANDFGFVKEKDIKDEEVSRESEINEDNPNKNLENLKNTNEPNVDYFQNDKEEQATPRDTETTDESKGKTTYMSVLTGVAKGLSVPKLPISNFTGALSSGIKIKLIGILILLIIIGVAFSYVYYNFILKADISVFADQKEINDELEVEFSASRGQNVIEIEIIEQEVSGENSKSATGTLETGEMAKGEVTISSSLNSQQVIEAGTILTAGGLDFILDENVTIASSSGVTDIKSAKGSVTADEIGREYNLPSGTKFTVTGFSSSSLEAKNDSAFAGGTKEEKTVVAESDLNALLISVQEKLEKEALSKVSSKLVGDEQVLAKVLSSEIVDHDFDKSAKDEASSVAITATVRYSVGKYNKDTLGRKISELSDTEIPENYSFSERESSIDISDIEVARDGKSASAKLKANIVYVPKIEGVTLGEKIAGKSEDYAIDEIKLIDGVSDVVINYRNAFPIFPKILPNNTKNISIEFKKN